MKKFQLLALFFMMVCSLSTSLLSSDKALAQKDLTVFFTYAHETLSQLSHELQTEKKAVTDQDQEKINFLNNLSVINAIARQDVQTLATMPVDQLQFKEGIRSINVPGDRFQETMEGRCVARSIAAENALGFVLIHSILDKTEQDEAKTLEMLQILFDKKLDFNTKFAFVYWITDNPNDERAYDYVSVGSLQEIASHAGSLKVKLLIKQYVPDFEITVEGNGDNKK